MAMTGSLEGTHKTVSPAVCSLARKALRFDSNKKQYNHLLATNISLKLKAETKTTGHS